MTSNAATLRRGLLGAFAAGALSATAGAMIASPAANAQPAPCTAAELSSVVSSVTGDASQFLQEHPDANDALTQAGSQDPEDAKASLRSYFFGHTDQYFRLQTIAQPLVDLRSRCNTNVSVGQVASLLDALTE